MLVIHMAETLKQEGFTGVEISGAGRLVVPMSPLNRRQYRFLRLIRQFWFSENWREGNHLIGVPKGTEQAPKNWI